MDSVLDAWHAQRDTGFVQELSSSIKDRVRSRMQVMLQLASKFKEPALESWR